MKLQCSMCGCHFPQDFEQTLKPPCNYWGEIGLSNISPDMKRELWDWLFSMPVDKMNILYNLDLPFTFKAVPIARGMAFEDVVINWNSLKDSQRQDFQRKWFLERRMGLPMPQLPIKYEPEN